ncbi:MAG: c-type cytochrome [Planctomycetota bacterium]|jgi:hypothetical protein
MKNMVLICILGACLVLTLLNGCETTTSQMSRGEILYSRKCSSCHKIIAPEKLNREGWSMYVSKYGKKMTAEERGILLDYLTIDSDSSGQKTDDCANRQSQ